MKTIDLKKLNDVGGGYWHGGGGGWGGQNPYWNAYRTVLHAERNAYAYQNAQAAAYWPLAYAYAASRYYY